MTTKAAQSSGGIGFFGLLGIAFIVLKLTGVVAWPWIWVLAPIWMPFVVALSILAIAGGYWWFTRGQ